MDDNSPSPRPFTARILPWILGAAFLVLYLATLHPWVGVSNLVLVGQFQGWEADLPYTEPVLYLVTLPLRLLPAALFPTAMNALAALFGALTIVVLARCVALLPHDRMREQRVRGHADDTLLHIRLAWLPVVFAAGLLGLQLTFWENATLQTGEMLDLLLLAFCVLALLEYRVDLREGWLWVSAFVYGAGIANNWAMIGFFPLYLVAVIWVRGWSFFHAGFLGRMLCFGLAGLSFYLVVPLVELVTGASDLGFWQTLKANLTIQKSYLLAIPRGRPLLLSLVSLLPLGLVAIRWQGTKGSSLERWAAVGGIVMLQAFWLGMAVYTAFDTDFSARAMVYLDRSSGELPLLSFSFAAALAGGYFAGWFLLVGGTTPAKNWERDNRLFTILGRTMAGLVMVGGIGVPVALVVKNWPAVRAQNSAATRDVARAMADQLPASSSLVLSDDTTAARLLQAELTMRSGGPPHVIMETRRGPDARYRQWLSKRYRTAIPELANFAAAKENVAGIMANLAAEVATKGPVVYLNPSFGFFFEQLRSRPLGVVFAVEPQPAEMAPPVATADQLAAALKVWEAQAPKLEAFARAQAASAPDARELGAFWSRAANSLGVELQRAGQLEAAGRVFAQARVLNPDNLMAVVNANVNTALRERKPLAANLSEPLARSPLNATLNADGPLDEPVALLNYGRALLFSTDRLPHQAWYAFFRAGQLSSNALPARFGQIEALMQAGEFKTARRQLDELKGGQSGQPFAAGDLASYTRLEVYYALAQGDMATAEKLIEGVRQKFASDTSLLDLLSALYIRQGRYDDAVPVLEQWRKLAPEEGAATLRLAAIRISKGDYESALRMLDQRLSRQPDDNPARINRAVCLLRLGRLDDSKREYLALVAKLPDLPMLHFGLGEVALRRKNTNDALAAFNKYLTLAPTNTLEYSNVVARVTELKAAR